MSRSEGSRIDLNARNPLSDKPFLLDEHDISYWAYCYCKNIKDDPKIRRLITDQFYCYLYCRNIDNKSELSKKITKSNDSLRYCLEVEDNPKIRKHITNAMDLVIYNEQKTEES